MEKLSRVDPAGCGCVDCIVGYSKPIDECNEFELEMAFSSTIDNASGCKIKRTVKYSIADSD